MPQDAILVNQKLEGYWVVIKDYRPESATTDSIFVVKFNKCRNKDRKRQNCSYSWSPLDSTRIKKNKLDKYSKENWDPVVTKNYWVEKKKNKETRRTVMHIDNFSEASIHLLKKELEFFRNDSLVLRLRKLK